MSRVRLIWERACHAIAGFVFFDRRNVYRVASTLLPLLFFVSVAGAKKEELPSPKWIVKGAGFIESRKLRNQLDLIHSSDEAFFQAADIEDAALVLLSFMEGKGYLSASAVTTIMYLDGEVEELVWDGNFDVFLPRGTKATSVRFDLIQGPRYYYEAFEVVGESTLDEEEIVEFFFSEGMLLQNNKVRIYTPAAMGSSSGNLEGHLSFLGYQDAAVTATEMLRNDETGAVSVKLEVNQGAHYLLDTIVVSYSGATLDGIDLSEFEGQAYSKFVLQDIQKVFRNAYFEAGYPEVKLSLETTVADVRGGISRVGLLVNVESGDRIRVGRVSFSGAKETKESMIRKRVEIEAGDWFNPFAINRTRMNLGRLGVFKEVSAEVDEVTDVAERSIEFHMTERQPWSVDLLLGWGSYEQLRAGVLVERINVLGKAHRARFKGTVSMKSSLAELRYQMPEIFNTPASLSTKLFALNREEVSFDREEFGVNVGLSRRYERFDLDTDLLYTFESLKALNVANGENLESSDETNVGSFELRVGRDRRDSPLNPREGNRFYSRLEWAAKELGGDVDYHRAEIGFSSHGEIKRGLYWHGGISHGVVRELNDEQSNVPTNKLFFPGGESSIRGFTDGEATPFDQNGNHVGARSFVQMNLELEQFLTESLSLVLFTDGIGITRTLAEYPFEETLVSVGIGLRIKTFMGPIRFEYGNNVKKRNLDPSGAFHFSIGFPF